MSSDVSNTPSTQSMQLLALMTTATATVALAMLLWRYQRARLLQFHNRIQQGATSAKNSAVKVKNSAFGMLKSTIFVRAELNKTREELARAQAMTKIYEGWLATRDASLVTAAEALKESETRNALPSREIKEVGTQTNTPVTRRFSLRLAPKAASAEAGTQTDPHEDFDRVSSEEGDSHAVRRFAEEPATSPQTKNPSPQSWWSSLFGSQQSTESTDVTASLDPVR